MSKTDKKAIRQAFRDSVFKRDKNRCRVCSASSVHLDAHHIIDRNFIENGGYVVENGISLCPPCHEKAEKELKLFLASSAGGHNYEPNKKYSPTALYALIKSSFEKAMLAASKLK